ncbi:MAG: response regulator [Chloroflexi bacterium]|nr:response regulator [Chloroflexota bacterium]
MASHRNVRVLIAEDDYLSGEMIKELLEGMAYTVVGEAGDGLEAFEMAQSLRPDVVLMDIEMPGVDGIEATQLIAENWDQCPTPVVMLTAYETKELVAEASAAGAGAYLVKPPDVGAMTRAITIAMARFDDMMALRKINRRLEKTLAELETTQQQLIQQERLAAVGQLSAGIAHEFNNVMASIILTSEVMLRSSPLQPDDQERLIAIRQEGHRAARLTQQILDFGRRSLMWRQDVNMILFITEMKNLLQHMLPDDIYIHTSCDVSHISVNADPDRLQQTLINLALNARDAMPEGGELHIELTRVQIESGQDTPVPEMEPGEWARVAISDNGTGITPEVLAHLYEPFFTTRAPMGSGLGLAQVYGIVKQHMGFIDVSTKVGEGTTFAIYLPALPAPLSAPSPREMAPPIQGNGETILVMEDNSLVRQALVDSLKVLNYCALTATNGQDALAFIEQHSDEAMLILYDPVMEGMELCRKLKQSNPSIRVVILTDYQQEASRDELKSVGVVDWLRKPLSLEQLALAVAHALKQ